MQQRRHQTPRPREHDPARSAPPGAEAADAPADAAAPAAARPVPVDRAQWQRPWAQLKFFTFQPAIFPRMLGEASGDAKPGDLVTVYDKAGARLGAGLYNPRAKMPLRVVVHTSEPVDESYFEQALRRAVALRRDLFKLDDTTDAYRVVNSDGDGLSGLTIDRYADVLFCDVYSLGIHQRLPRWLPLLHGLLGTKHAHVHVDHEIASVEGIRTGRWGEQRGGGDAPAGSPDAVKIREHGVRYEVDFAEGHKTGFFCDQRDNRRRLGQLVRGARVLDLCSYTGGFSINAAKGGAAEITAVDLDEAAIAQGRRNANLNQVSPNLLKWVHADAFAYARQMFKNGERFDAIVCDPPKFVFTREPAGRAEGMGKYSDLNQLAVQLVKPGGLFVTCSCSGLVSDEEFEGAAIKAAHRAQRRLQIFDRTGAGVDHPVYSNCLESRYLKVLWARVM
ncbi:MAG TPA: class I SAM-dependent rRNA methyltransferase [Opitutaceae bacterium]|nr:class I SAM-dependent rRNA methyltransferase [Opitutaceae bacterium]